MDRNHPPLLAEGVEYKARPDDARLKRYGDFPRSVVSLFKTHKKATRFISGQKHPAE